MRGAYFVITGMALAACAFIAGGIEMVPNTWAGGPASKEVNDGAIVPFEDRARSEVTIDDAVDEVSYPFQGIKRTHRTTSIPRPLNINVLEVTLNDPGISFFVTPGNPDPGRGSCGEAIASRTSTAVAEFDLQVGINGDFSDPDCNFDRREGEATGVYGLGVSYRQEIPSSGLPMIPRDQYSPHNNRPALTLTQSNEAYIGLYEPENPFPP